MGHSAKIVNGFVTQKVSHVRSNGLEVFCRESCSKKFRKILRKTLRNTENTVPESLFNTVAGTAFKKFEGIWCA